MKLIDDFLNNITMYRLVLYFLLALILWGMVMSFFGLLSFSPLSLIFSVGFLIAVSWTTNKVFAWGFNAVTNLESVYITALILALIITPAKSLHDVAFLFWAAVLAMGSKYILAIGGKHLFNPAALAVAITALTINSSSSWWVGTAVMLPLVLAGGLLVIRKIDRADLAFSFLVASFLTIGMASILRGTDLITTITKTIIDSPWLFFIAIMLTEPLTTPPTKKLQAVYGALVGLFFYPLTPELALVAGNVFSYLASPKEKLFLTLKEKIQLAPDVYDFVYEPDKKLNFSAGQYLEWTLTHPRPDDRGNRRYFTLASSPTEKDLRIGVKFDKARSSSFKTALLNSNNIVASQLAGEFTLSKDPNIKLAFVAGGIGITPFRSMIKFLTDAGQKRDIVLFYANSAGQEPVYRETLEKIPVKYITGRLSDRDIAEGAPDWKERKFYLSGSHAMVTGVEDTLRKMGLPRSQIKTDYFPGFA
ncbi:MAG: oxidoreductase [Patescibacteria group bacterium]|nr:oxidoreductase [Patescibacteria group bacterium]MCL5431634.1 oxidoreductase [Patescibacteria group bacterium]